MKKNFRDNPLVIIVIATIIILVAYVFVNITGKDVESCKAASNTFASSVINKNTKLAQKYSTGKVTWRINNLKGMKAAKATSVESNIVYIRGGCAHTSVTCEFVYKQNGKERYDVAWFDFYLVKVKDQWKIYNLAEGNNEITGINFVWDKKNKDRLLSEYVSEFIGKASRGEDVNQYLAGPALAGYKKVPSGVVMSKVVGLRIDNVYLGGKNAVFTARYSMDNRKVNLLISLYNVDGWKITSIKSI